MKNLLWREFHWNRVVVIEAIIVFLLPYTIALILLLWPRKFALKSDEIEYAIMLASLYSLAISQITVPFLAGNAFAGERSDRTSEFLAYLPLSRGQRLGSKLLFAGIVVALIWAINWPVLEKLGDPKEFNLSETARYTAATGFVMFGVAWCFSSFLTSPTISACAGIAVPIMIVLSLQIAHEALRRDTQAATRDLLEIGYPVAALVLGTFGFVLGTWLFIRRVEP